ncbi:MAG TPA: hypothetical protein VMJ10_02615 [Kofleriaceae bacterium]|nr:hypothetical protein [Kofleriaceae bacterium]
MRPFLTWIATRLSRFRYVAGIAVVVACLHSTAPQPDLSGTVACGDFTCGTGELCFDSERDGSNGSADPIDEFSCLTPPADCPLYACDGQCPAGGNGNLPCCPACLVDGPLCSYDGKRDVGCVGF